MTLATFVHAIRKSWRLVLACTLAGLLSAVLATATATKTYESSATMVVGVANGTSATDVNQGADYALRQMTTYVGMVTSSAVLTPVIDELKLDTTAAELATRVTAATPTDTMLIDVTVKDTDPQRTADTANAISEQFGKVLKAQAPAPGGSKVVNAQLVTPAVLEPAPTAPATGLNIAIGLLGGFAIGALVAAVRAVVGQRPNEPAPLKTQR